MWTLITNCDKQITVQSVVRERVNELYKEYVIANVEFDQFHLELASFDGEITAKKQHNTLTCLQLKEYGFEVKVEEEV